MKAQTGNDKADEGEQVEERDANEGTRIRSGKKEVCTPHMTDRIVQPLD